MEVLLFRIAICAFGYGLSTYLVGAMGILVFAMGLLGGSLITEASTVIQDIRRWRSK